MQVHLFQQDFLKRPAYYHTTSRNTSWVRLATVLKRMGVANHSFFLALLDRSLEHVDPHSETLSVEMQERVIVEAFLNPWYFFREVLRLPSSGSGTGPFILNRASLAVLWCIFAGFDIGLIQPRQTGKTITVMGIICYFMFFRVKSYNIGMVVHQSFLIQENINKLKVLRDNLPWYFIEKSVRDLDNKEGLSYDKNKNYLRTWVANNSPFGAEKVGRGPSIPMFHYDEVPFIAYNWISLPASANSMIAAAEQVKNMGLPAPKMYTTTAGDPDRPEGRYALNWIFNTGCPFNDKFYDVASLEEIDAIVKKTSKTNMMYIEYSYKQLGKDKKWHDTVVAEAKGSQDQINRDIYNIWTPSKDRTIIPAHLIELIRNSRLEPSVDISGEYPISWYVDRDIVKTNEYRQRHLILGADTSENVGRDFTTLVIIDPRDAKVQAVARGNDSNTYSVAKYILQLMLDFPNLVWIPERKSTAVMMVDFVIEGLSKRGINPYRRIFNLVVQNFGDQAYKKYDISSYSNIAGSDRAVFGYTTHGGSGGTSRNALYKDTLMKSIEMNHSRIYDRNLINEICSLTMKNGRIDHQSGGHDDTLIAYLLCCWLIYYGKNLSMYGIPESAVLESVSVAGETVKPGEKQRQIDIAKRITYLEECLKRNPAHMIRQTYLKEISDLKLRKNEKILDADFVSRAQIQDHDKKVGSVSVVTTDKVNQASKIFQRFYG